MLPDGGLAVAGYRGHAAWVFRLDADGHLLWEKTFGKIVGMRDNVAAALAVLPDGGLALAGTIEPKGGGSYEAWVFRLDTDGGLVWEKTFGSMGGAWLATALVAMPDGGVAVAGDDGGFGLEGDPPVPGSHTLWILQLDADGNLLWHKTFDGGGRALVTLPDGGLAVAGSTKAGSRDAWILRLPPEGNLRPEVETSSAPR